jgi:hypothetical protein
MAHSNSIADSYGIEFKGNAARAANRGLDHLRNLIEVNMTRHYLTKTVGDADEWFVNVDITEPAGAKQTAMRRPLKTFFDCVASHNPVSPKLSDKVIQEPENSILTVDKGRIKKNQLSWEVESIQ